MINSNYKTIYCKNHNNTYADMIDTIAFSTEMQYVKWQRKYDYQANLYYWYGEDKISVSSPNAGEVKIDRPKPQKEQRGRIHLQLVLSVFYLSQSV